MNPVQTPQASKLETITGRFEWDNDGQIFFLPDNAQNPTGYYWNGKITKGIGIWESGAAVVGGHLAFSQVEPGKFALHSISVALCEALKSAELQNDCRANRGDHARK